MEFNQLEQTNIFEEHITNNNPCEIYAFSPRIYSVFNEVSRNIENLPKYALAYIGNDSFSYTVHFYKCSNDIVYIFLIGMDGIKEHYLL